MLKKLVCIASAPLLLKDDKQYHFLIESISVRPQANLVLISLSCNEGRSDSAHLYICTLGPSLLKYTNYRWMKTQTKV